MGGWVGVYHNASKWQKDPAREELVYWLWLVSWEGLSLTGINLGLIF